MRTLLRFVCALSAAQLIVVPAYAEEFDPEFEMELLEWRIAQGDPTLVLDSALAIPADGWAFVTEFTIEGDSYLDVEEVGIKGLAAVPVGPDISIVAGGGHTFRPGDDRSYATVGLEALLSNNVGGEVLMELSDRGDITGSAELVAELPITENLVFEPRAELGWAFKDVPREGLGHGLNSVGASVRLRRGVTDTVNVYVGAGAEWLIGRTRDLAVSAGDDGDEYFAIIGLGFVLR